jgi:hypothetical protein
MMSGFELSDVLVFAPVLAAAAALAFVLRVTRARQEPPLSRRERIQRRRELAGLPADWSRSRSNDRGDAPGGPEHDQGGPSAG